VVRARCSPESEVPQLRQKRSPGSMAPWHFGQVVAVGLVMPFW
jgi:hypothetical protein